MCIYIYRDRTISAKKLWCIYTYTYTYTYTSISHIYKKYLLQTFTVNKCNVQSLFDDRTSPPVSNPGMISATRADSAFVTRRGWIRWLPRQPRLNFPEILYGSLYIFGWPQHVFPSWDWTEATPDPQLPTPSDFWVEANAFRRLERLRFLR